MTSSAALYLMGKRGFAATDEYLKAAQLVRCFPLTHASLLASRTRLCLPRACVCMQSMRFICVHSSIR